MNEIEVTIDVNYKCNMNCPFCSTDSRLTPLEMSDNVARGCLDFLQELKKESNGELSVVISGGEPVIFDKLSSYIEMWGTVSNKMILCTNGSLVKDKQYWSTLRSLGLCSVRLSYHGTSEGIANAMFGSLYSLDNVQKTIEAIQGAGLSIEINYVLTQINADQLKYVFEFCSKNNIAVLRILGLAKQGRAANNWNILCLSEERCKEIAALAREMSHHYKVNVRFAGLSSVECCTHSDAKGNCLGGKKFFHITSNGDIYPCPGVKAVARYRIGSVLDSNYRKDVYLPSRTTSCLVLDQCGS